jgi:hypothetical protein
MVIKLKKLLKFKLIIKLIVNRNLLKQFKLEIIKYIKVILTKRHLIKINKLFLKDLDYRKSKTTNKIK